MPGAKQDRKHRDNDAEEQGQPILPDLPGGECIRAPRHDLDTVGNRLDLQCQQGQQGDAHGHGDGGAHPGTAKAECQHVCKGCQLVYPAQAQQGQQQQRGEDKHEDHTAIIKQEAVAIAVGELDDPVGRHGAGENPERQHIGCRVAADAFRDYAAVRQVGDAKQAGEINDDENENLGETKAHPGISSAGSSRWPR